MSYGQHTDDPQAMRAAIAGLRSTLLAAKRDILRRHIDHWGLGSIHDHRLSPLLDKIDHVLMETAQWSEGVAP